MAQPLLQLWSSRTGRTSGLRVPNSSRPWRATPPQPRGLLDHRPRFELTSYGSGRFRVEREQQYARGALIKTVHWKYTTTNLVAQQLNGKSRFLTIEVAAMYEQAGRLMHGN